MKTENTLLDRLVTAAVMGLLAWNVYTTQHLSVEVAVIRSNLDGIFADRYTGTQADARSQEVNRRLDRLERLYEELTKSRNQNSNQ